MKKLEIPVGMEIDLEKSNIVYKPITPTWENFGPIEGYYIDADSRVLPYDDSNSNEHCRNTWPTKEDAEAALALSQLLQWRDKYNEGWKPDYKNGDKKYIICTELLVVKKGFTYNHNSVLSFKEESIRDKFLNDFKDLIEIAKPLI